MTAHLVVEVTDDLLNSISDGGTVTVRIVRGTGRSAAAPTAAERQYRKGSHPQKLVDWAAKRGKQFGVDDVTKTLGVTRSHASMILNKVVNDAGPIRRVSRGVYGFEGAAPAATKPARRKSRKRATAKKAATKKRAKRKTKTKRARRA